MTKTEKTKQFIIEKSSVHFNKIGYLGTSLRDITNLTGLTKGSIYGNFENKEEVAKAAYKYNAKRIGNKIISALNQSPSGAINKLMAIVDFYKNNWSVIIETGGCPLLNAATESDDAFPKLNIEVRKSFIGFTKIFEDIIKNGIEERIFKHDLNIKEYASTMVMLIEGGVLLSKTMADKEYLNISLKRIENLIHNEMKL
ncbi:TetR/AcrR family transcriptional regulator [Mariniflexile gromovii]|uniref:TetR/AcrR family transcriptional regulator n=2 Tax=Mariniflexile gromovii TaxID=362523 RepID=A0ABS4BWT8_9FLAO|nr:TetR/AcrR family transcriptional regulator [Mariniflexile gromovii]